jgi:DNA-binding NtrC family response regulator
MDNKAKILIVDDLQDMRLTLTKILRREGYETVTANNGLSAIEVARKEIPDAVVMDNKMPRMDGIEALKLMKEIAPTIPIVLMTAYGEIETAVHAVKLGAYDYITKPFDNEKIIITLKNALTEINLKREIKRLHSTLHNRATLTELMGSSSEIKNVFTDVNRVSSTNFTVILYGETGSGKELVARAIHDQSPRNKFKFVAIDCNAIPETLIESELFGYERGAFTGAEKAKKGYFELSYKGTLFLDEVANLSKNMQSKLLRALEERCIRRLGGKEGIEIDVRILVASNKKLDDLVNAGRFREDLYHRLNEFTIEIPALRNRKEDIIHLSKRFLDEINLELNKTISGFSETAINYLISYNWPGNVRELRNVIRRSALQVDNNALIEPRNLSIKNSKLNVATYASLIRQPFKAGMDDYVSAIAQTGSELSLKDIVKKGVSNIEKHVIMEILKRTGGNKSKAARILKIDYKTMHYKVKEYDIQI